MRAVDLIEKKKRGGCLSKEELAFLVNGFVKGEVESYQMAAFLMAVCFQKMTPQETCDLTMVMAESGDTLDLSAIHGKKVDKHSTGGVGDKTSLILAPMVAAVGVPVAKMSGRGLGHTGGTIDKLESIPGFQTALTREEFIRNVNEIHIALTGQTENLAPADKKIYGLRDVTATIDSIPLIAGSIMSKKLASGADAIVLDVKCGSGAFMKTKADAFELAKTMTDIGKRAKRQVLAVVSDMNQPLGRAVGNSLEIIEVIEVLKGRGPEDLTELCLTLGSLMVTAAELADSVEEAREKLEDALKSGAALKKFREFVIRQGGDAEVIENYGKLPQASFVQDLYLADFGVCDDGGLCITAIQCEGIGLVSMGLGGGRQKSGDKIDLSVGLWLHKKTGDKVAPEDKIITLYANSQEAAQEAKEKLRACYEFGPGPVKREPLIKGFVD